MFFWELVANLSKIDTFPPKLWLKDIVLSVKSLLVVLIILGVASISTSSGCSGMSLLMILIEGVDNWGFIEL